MIDNKIKPNSAYRHSHIVIEQVSKEEEKLDKKRISKRVMIKVSFLIHKMAEKSDPRLAWLMFQNIYLMYCEIKNK